MYIIYLLMLRAYPSEFLAAFVSTAFVVLMAEILARTLKAPAMIFITTAIVPIVPGSGLYYSMKHLLWRDWTNFIDRFKSMLSVAFGIVCGIIFVAAAFKLVMSLFMKKAKNTIDKRPPSVLYLSELFLRNSKGSVGNGRTSSRNG